MAGLRKISTLLWFLILIGIQVNQGGEVNANPVVNDDAIENDSSWLTRWQKCFFNDASEDVGHFFLTRLINCWPTTISSSTYPAVSSSTTTTITTTITTTASSTTETVAGKYI